jgi:hypothetical protein
LVGAPIVSSVGPNPPGMERIECAMSQYRGLRADWTGAIRGMLSVWEIFLRDAMRGGPMPPTMARTWGYPRQGSITAEGSGKGSIPCWKGEGASRGKGNLHPQRATVLWDHGRSNRKSGSAIWLDWQIMRGWVSASDIVPGWRCDSTTGADSQWTRIAPRRLNYSTSA